MIQTLQEQLDPLGREILTLRLQGEAIADIAAKVNRSERTVLRKLGDARGFLEAMLHEDDDC